MHYSDCMVTTMIICFPSTIFEDSCAGVSQNNQSCMTSNIYEILKPLLILFEYI